MADDYMLSSAVQGGDLDWERIQAEQESESLGSRIGSFITGWGKGSVLTAVSAVYGVANTVPLIANLVGGQGTMEYLETLKAAEALDEAWGNGETFSQFYRDHSTGIELTGAIVGAFAPGGLAVAGERVALGAMSRYAIRSAEMNSGNIVGKAASWYTTLEPTSAKTKILRESYESLLTPGNSGLMTSLMPLDRFKFAVASAGQMGIDAAVFETAAILTQLKNPTYSDIQDLGDFTKAVGWATAFGGGLGGILGPMFWKGSKFLPSADATEEITLRGASSIIGNARQKVLDISDFGEKLKNISPGSKIAGLLNDRELSQALVEANIDSLFKGLPADAKDKVLALSKSWVKSKGEEIDRIASEQLKQVVKTKNSNIGEDVYNMLIKAKEDGSFPLSGESTAQIFGELNGIQRLLVTLPGDSPGALVKGVSKLTEENARAIMELFEQSPVGTRVKTLETEIASLRDFFEKAGFKKNPAKASLPEHLHGQFDLKQQYQAELAKINKTLPGNSFREIMKDPSRATEKMAKAAGLTDDQWKKFLSLIDPGEQGSVTHFLDLVTGKLVSSPTIMLGDFLAKSGGRLRYNKFADAVLSDDGAQLLVPNISKSLNSPNMPVSMIEAQAKWQVAENFLAIKRELKGKGLDIGNGIPSPFKLRAALEANAPIFIDGVEISRDMALRELTRLQLAMREHALQIHGMTEEQARLYANLPLNEKLTEAFVSSGRLEHNYLSRRNVIASYEEATKISETDLKSIQAIRDMVLLRQTGAAQAAYDIAISMGIEFPEPIRNAAQKLLEFGLNGADPIDFGARIGAGAVTNASGRMFTANTQATALGTFLRNKIVQGQTAIDQALAGDLQAILKGTSPKEDLNLVSLIHQKITGGGSKWHNAELLFDELGIPADDLAGLYITRDAAKAIKKSFGRAASSESDEAFEKFSDELADLLTDSKNTFRVDNPRVNSLLKNLANQDANLRKAQLDILGSRGYDISDFIPGELYFPPLDTARSPFFVMVRDASRATIDGAPRYSFVHAKSAEALESKVAQIRDNFPEFEILRQDKLKIEKELAGEFEWAKSFYAYNIDSQLASKNIFSEVGLRNPQEILDESVKHLKDAYAANTRQLFRNITGDFIDQNNRLSETLEPFAKSRHGKAFAAGTRGRTGDNIYAQMNRTLFDIGPGEDAVGILGATSRIQNLLTDFVDSTATKARDYLNEVRVGSPKRIAEREAALESIQEEAKKLGMDPSLFTSELLKESQRFFGDVKISKATQAKLNSVSVILTLGMDLINPIVQSLSLPMTINSSLRRLLRDAPEDVKQRLATLGVTGKAARIGSKETINYWKDVMEISRYEKFRSGAKLPPNEQLKLDQWLASPNGKFFHEMSDLGLIPPSMRQTMIEIEMATDVRDFIAGKSKSLFTSAVKLASAPTRYAEVFQRYLALKVADGISSAAKLPAETRYNLMHAFATQSNGVYTAAQRPGLFQGAIGGAFGLYKSYAINMFQALARHIEDRDVKAVLGLAGIQGLVFGARSIPGAPILDKYIQVQNEEDKRDMYSTAQLLLGEDAGNTMLYGLGSALTGAGIYSRGDFNMDLMGNPLDPKSYPGVSQFLGVFNAVRTAGSQIMAGSEIDTALINAAAAQSLSRPVARVGEYLRGAATTRSGTLIYPIDNDKLFSLNLLIRAAGARPYSEAVLSDAYHREMDRKFSDQKSMADLRTRLRSAIRAGDDIDMDRAVDDYVRAGGDPRSFRRWFQSQIRSQSKAEVERLQEQNMKRGKWQHLQELDLPD